MFELPQRCISVIFPLKMVVSDFRFSLNSHTYGLYGVPLLFQVQLLFDAIFSIVPAPFKQCLIAKVFDAALKIYVSVAWVLMMGKSDECYWYAFNWLCNSVECI